MFIWEVLTNVAIGTGKGRMSRNCETFRMFLFMDSLLVCRKYAAIDHKFVWFNSICGAVYLLYCVLCICCTVCLLYCVFVVLCVVYLLYCVLCICCTAYLLYGVFVVLCICCTVYLLYCVLCICCTVGIDVFL
jgi:hypothetical protein